MEYNSQFGLIKLLSLKQFFKKIKVEYTSENQVIVDFLINEHGGFNEIHSEEKPHGLAYTKRIFPLTESDDQFEQLRNYLFLQSSVKDIFMKLPVIKHMTEDQILKRFENEGVLLSENALHVAEDIALIQCDQFSEPEYLVRVGKRMWMSIDPNNYKIVRNGNKVALVCLKPYSSYIHRIWK